MAAPVMPNLTARDINASMGNAQSGGTIGDVTFVGGNAGAKIGLVKVLAVIGGGLVAFWLFKKIKRG